MDSVSLASRSLLERFELACAKALIHDPSMKKALVAGALGVTGRAAVNYLVSLGDWEVIGLSRRTPEFRTSAKYIAIDLLNRSALEDRLREIADITHIFFAALQPAAIFLTKSRRTWRCSPIRSKWWNALRKVCGNSCSWREQSFTERHLGP